MTGCGNIHVIYGLNLVGKGVKINLFKIILKSERITVSCAYYL